MSVCLFVWGSLSHLRIYHFYEDVTISGEGLQYLANMDDGHCAMRILSLQKLQLYSNTEATLYLTMYFM